VLTKERISLELLKRQLPVAGECGASVWFEGVVRNHNDGKRVEGIEYECYEAMARRELETIVAEMQKRWPIDNVRVAHRIGFLEVGETSLVVGVASPHRKEAFEAIQYFIDELKKRVPIWKKEIHATGRKEWLAS